MNTPQKLNLPSSLKMFSLYDAELGSHTPEGWPRDWTAALLVSKGPDSLCVDSQDWQELCNSSERLSYDIISVSTTSLIHLKLFF